ncbi:uncharacterized protein LOC126901931 [Daktulosphaira vitifoliae]|uniref:uncharacterized protein LOC126901931 n=1 Tax=Daktulosphaira vitifoliae TaxID=58002 RepID=UPI0021A9E1D0|nr:uncharacterized protein LOC126901931 [Daktulosphaira vitifoliae]XP_050534835.1 uncharacterized protein LOC126901931 [Daktulosphaira vitifoliae]
MSTFYNQPFVRDIVSAFESSQNQSWSTFNDKLGNTPIKDCKKKDFLKSENPIELSNEDVPVFGLIPRLENLVLVTCNICSMVVKRDCLHFHFNHRHNNLQNDNFTLEQFLLPNIKVNRLKKPKLNGRKIRGKKLVDGDSLDSIVQDIKSDYNRLDFIGITDLKEEKNERVIEVPYENECDIDMTIKSYNPNTDCGVLDWSLKPCTQSLAHCTDHKVKDRMAVTGRDKDFDKLLAESLGIASETKFYTNNNYLNIVNDEINENSVSSFIPVSSNTRIVNNTLTPSSIDDFKYEFDDDSLWNFDVVSKFNSFPWSPDSKNEDSTNSLTSFSNEKNSKITSDCETSTKLSSLERKKKYVLPFYNGRHFVQNSQIDLNKKNELSFMNNKHFLCKARLKEALDNKKLTNKKFSKISQKNNLETMMNKLLSKQNDLRVFSDKENCNRWITDYNGFKKIKRAEFVIRKIPCSDDSDSNDMDE